MSRRSRHTRTRGRHYGSRSVHEQLHPDEAAGSDPPAGTEPELGSETDDPYFEESDFDDADFDDAAFADGTGEADFDDAAFADGTGEFDLDLPDFANDGNPEGGDEFEDGDDGPDPAASPADGLGPPSGPGGRGVRRRRHHPVMTGLAILVVLVVVAGVVGARWVHGALDPSGKPGPRVAVTIPRHASLRTIGQRLARAGVIRSAALFPYFAKLEGSAPLLPGTYHLPKRSSYNKVLDVLEKGPPVIRDILVIPEGFTLDQIAARIAALPKLHLSAQKVLAASSSGKVRSPYEPAGTNNLEGLVFPATYQVTSGESEVEILRQMVEAFDERADEIGLVAGAKTVHMTPYQIVIIASMVEREARLEADRGPIASVIYNRLKINMPLQIDSTLMYGLKATNPNTMNLNSTNPYNTYRYKGLPPTPIASPGLPSLEAALHPSKTTYLYYAVVDPDGKSAFASTYSQFQQIEAICRARHLC